MTLNYFHLVGLALGILAFILFFAAWIKGRAATPSDSERKATSRLTAAGLIFFFLAMIVWMIQTFRPVFGERLFTQLGTSVSALGRGARPSASTTV